MNKRVGRLITVILLALFLFAEPAWAENIKLNNTRQYLIRHTVTVKNDSNILARNINIRVPLMDERQPVYQQLIGEKYSLQPLLLYTDANGNRYALFYIYNLPAGASRELHIDYYVANSSLDYHIDASQLILEYPGEDFAKYLVARPGIESDANDIKHYAAKFLQGDTDNPYNLAKKLFADLNLYMTYGKREDDETGALAALRSGRGLCRDYSELYVAVLRAMGIPARLQTGYFYEPAKHIVEPYISSEKGCVDLSLLAHTWAEFYIPSIGWVPADPTFTYTVNFGGTEQKLVNWDYFAMIPSYRRYFYFTSEAYIPDVTYEYMGGDISLDLSAELYPNAVFIPFDDIEGHWAENDILYLYNRKLVSGVTYNKFSPDTPVSRAEFAVMLYRAAGLTDGSGIRFGDVDSTAWYAPYVSVVAKQGLMIGDGSSFRPGAFMTRAELAAVMCRYKNIPQKTGALPFEDVSASHWAAGAVSALYERGLLAGKSESRFAPSDIVTRAEAAAMLSRLFRYNYQ